ncbi:MAG TPA: phosphoribosylformylglycinamidine synthase I, partial [Sulfuricurvum sp.]|nr:phosphoribosylformylglycinamidine synthase I [Sulfuricurvum sp.]
RSGAIARISPVMHAVEAFAKKGGNVLGICNGFQVLTESGLLPGALKRNDNLHFISRHHHLKVIGNDNAFLKKLEKECVVNIPIAHHDGNYYIGPEGLKALYDNDQVLLHYCDADGNVSNPNGSVDAIAGVCNKGKNVFGLMPHPERAMESVLGSDDGIAMLEGFIAS